MKQFKSKKHSQKFDSDAIPNRKRFSFRCGAHLSTSKGVIDAFQKLIAIGGNCLQLFSTSPRMWMPPRQASNEVAKSNRTEKERLKIAPIYFHASYLVNLADEDRIGNLSKTMLIAELKLASQYGFRGSIVHLGSYKQTDNQQLITDNKYKTLLRNIKEILRKTPKETLLIIENAGTRKIGQTLEELGQIVRDTKSPRVRICLDTCHLHTAGYDLTTKEKLNAFLIEMDKKIGLDKLEVWHANDSRDPFGSLRDRHDNIGQGQVGINVFKLLLNHPKTKILPFIIETPGFDNLGPDKKNLDILKSLT